MTSARPGIEGEAPGLDTAMEAAFEAILKASGMVLPSVTAARK